jgi:hypothetical protein
MKHKFLRLFVDGEWTGNSDRSISIAGVKHDLDEYAKAHGIDLPDAKKSKKTINTDVEVKDEDMERSHDTGSTEIDGDGDSESTE